jgi:hypothetical protein
VGKGRQGSLAPLRRQIRTDLRIWGCPLLPSLILLLLKPDNSQVPFPYPLFSQAPCPSLQSSSEHRAACSLQSPLSGHSIPASPPCQPLPSCLSSSQQSLSSLDCVSRSLFGQSQVFGSCRLWIQRWHWPRPHEEAQRPGDIAVS